MDSDVEVYRLFVLYYINFCTDLVITLKLIKVFWNQKPWVNKEARELLKIRDVAYKAQDTASYSLAKANLKHRYNAGTMMQAKSTSIPYQPSLNCHWKEMTLGMLLQRIKPRKDTEPDGVLECVLQTCTDHLAEVFTNIFNLSLISGSAQHASKLQPLCPFQNKELRAA